MATNPATPPPASSNTSDFVKGLACWNDPVDPKPLGGGTTNTNFTVEYQGSTFMVRVGDDLPLHGILRSREAAACRAAYACGLSPEIIHHEPGALVMAFIQAKTLSKADIAQPQMLERIVELLRQCHTNMPTKLTGASLMFWVFQVNRQYLRTVESGSCRLAARLAELAAVNTTLEQQLGPIQPTFCHNDLLPANILDDGERLWLLDWEYAGWNTPLFDLANLASNADLDADQTSRLLESYLRHAPSDHEQSSVEILACASLLRELLWSLVQESHSSLDFDFETYGDQQLSSFETAYDQLQARR
jgi:thiamine kinase-like enzyme